MRRADGHSEGGCTRAHSQLTAAQQPAVSSALTKRSQPTQRSPGSLYVPRSLKSTCMLSGALGVLPIWCSSSHSSYQRVVPPESHVTSWQRPPCPPRLLEMSFVVSEKRSHVKDSRGRPFPARGGIEIVDYRSEHARSSSSAANSRVIVGCSEGRERRPHAALHTRVAHG